MWRTIAVVSALILFYVASASAQSVSGLQAGARVRIDIDGASSFKGVLLEPPGDSARVSTSTGTRVIALADVSRFRVSRGREGRGRSMLRKGGIAGLVGAVGGMALGFAAGDDDPGTWFAWTAGEKAAVGGVFIGSLGFVIGSIIGLATPAERWEPATLR